MRRALLSSAFIAVLLILWEMLYRLGLWEPYLFPSPFEVVETIGVSLVDRTLPIGVAISLKRLLLGYLLSLIIGISLGLSVGRVRLLDETVGTLLLGLQTLPSICWLPLALLWFGLNEKAIIFVVVMGAVLSIAIATDTGVRQVQPLHLKAARNMGAKGWRLYRSVILPAALPSIITGMKQGWSFAWRALMAGELLFVNGGLGQLLMMGRELNDMTQVVAVMLVIITIGLIGDRFLFAIFERKIHQRWGLEQV